MERTEPALVPEWLRCAGSIAGGGASVHLSDISSSAHSMQNRSFRSNNYKESQHYLQRSSSSNSRRSSSSNGSAKHPYSSFSRNHWDRNRDREKPKSIAEDIWEHDFSDPLASILTSRVERNPLRRSQSLISGKIGEPSSQRVHNKNSHISGNGLFSRGSNLNVIQQSVFENDFPSLGTEDKPGIRRVSSPGLSSAVQSLPIGSSGFLGGEKWTSALAEVPATVVNNDTCHSPLQNNVSAFPHSSSGDSSGAGLNMAEALSQPAARVHANPLLPDKNQRLEELAIKQSRQLIPVTPSMPKPLVTGAADKPKQSKIALRANETTVIAKAVHSQAHPSYVSSRGGQIRSESASNPHVGKYLVLKPGRENMATGSKDVCSPTGYVNGRVAKDGQIPIASSATTAAVSTITFTVSALENKSAALSLSSRSSVEKRSTQSLSQSRSEFFNLMRRKASVHASAIHSDSSLDVLTSSAEISGENCNEGRGSATRCSLDDGNQMICNGDGCNITENCENVGGSSCSISPDEEETAFLRSLGWEENGGEDEGLTEEEINAFYQEYMNRRPSLEVCQSSLPKLECSNAAVSDISSDSSSSEFEP